MTKKLRYTVPRRGVDVEQDILERQQGGNGILLPSARISVRRGSVVFSEIGARVKHGDGGVRAGACARRSGLQRFLHVADDLCIGDLLAERVRRFVTMRRDEIEHRVHKLRSYPGAATHDARLHIRKRNRSPVSPTSGSPNWP